MAPWGWRVGLLKVALWKSKSFTFVNLICIDKYTRKKKKSKSKTEISIKDQDVKELLFQKNEDNDNVPSGSGRNSPAVSSNSSRKTEAEKRFEEAQKRRVRFLISYSLNIYIFFLLCSSRNV